MAGLLDFLKSPEGQGLVSGISGYAATARRGTPINNIGRGLLAGTAGLNTALDKQKEVEKQQMMKSFFGMGAPAGASQNMPAGVQQPMGAAQPAGLAGKSIDQIAAAKALMGIDVLEPWKIAHTGLEKKGGNYFYNPSTGKTELLPNVESGITYDPQTQQAGPIAGYAQTKAQQAGMVAGAEAGAKHPYAIAQNRDQQYIGASLAPQEVIDPVTGETRIISRLQAVNGGGYGGGQGYGGDGGNTGGGGYVTKRNPAVAESEQLMNKNWIDKSFNPTVDSGRSAAQRAASLQALRTMNIQTGWGAETMAKAAGILSTFGVENAEKYASNAQMFQSVTMENLMKSLMEQKGPQTEGDAQRASKTFVSLQNTPQANEFIMDFAQAQANHAQRKAAFYEEAMPMARQMGDLTLVDREWKKIEQSIWRDPALQKWNGQQQDTRTGSR